MREEKKQAENLGMRIEEAFDRQLSWRSTYITVGNYLKLSNTKTLIPFYLICRRKGHRPSSPFFFSRLYPG